MEMRGDVTDAGQTTKRQKLKIELLSQWKVEAESRNLVMMTLAMEISMVNKFNSEKFHFYPDEH